MIHRKEVDRSSDEARVLVVTPRKREAGLIQAALQRAGIKTWHCSSVAACLREPRCDGADLMILAEEAFASSESLESLLESMAADTLEPPTLVLLARRRDSLDDPSTEPSLRERLGSFHGVTVLERPLRPVSFVSAVESCLELRRTQREIRSHLRARQQQEQSLSDQREMLRVITDALPALICYVDREHRFQFNNAAYREWYGVDPQSLHGRKIDEIWDDATYRTVRPFIEAALNGQPQEFEADVSFPVSGSRYIRGQLTPHIDPDGSVRGVFATVIDLTQRRASERALIESQQRYRDLIQALPAAVYTCDVQGRILLYNQAAVELWGCEPIVGSDFWCGSWNIFRPDGSPMPLSECPMAITIREGRAVRDVEIVVERPDGTRRNVLPHPDPIFDASGALVGAVNMLFDITDRKRHEQTLQALVECTRTTGSDFFEELVRVLSESLRMHCVFVCELLPGERKRARSKAVYQQGKPAPDFEFELDGTACAAVAGQETGVYPSQVTAQFPRDALLKRLGAESFVAAPLRAADGRVIGILAAVGARPLDQTSQSASLLQVFAGHAATELERQRAEHTLRCNEEQFRRAIDDAPVPVIVHADDGQILRVSKTWSLLTGISIGEVRRFDEWLARYRNGAERVREGIRDLFDGRVDAIDAELDITSAEGERRVWSLSASSPGTLDDGRRFVVSMAVDITDRKRSEDELTRYHELLEQLVRERTAELERSHAQLRLSERMAALGTLSAGLGHDMGNLLLPVRLRMEAMESKGVPTELQEDLEAIRKCTEYLQRLANGLRLFALDPEESGGQPHRTDLQDWWSDVEAFLRNVLPRAIELEQRFADDLPPIAMPRHRLTQAVFNLVQNAGNAMRGQTSGNVVVWAEPSADGRSIRVGVSDDGPGMSPDVRARCLEPFFTTNTRSISTGLGLSLVHGIVAKAGGSITIESERGRGTTFVLALPAVATSPSGQAEPDRRAVVSGLDPRMKSYVASLLRPLGYEVSFNDALNGGLNGEETNLWITVGGEASYGEATAFATRKTGRRAIVFGYKPDGRPVPQVVCFSRVPKPTVVRETLRLVSDEVVSELRDSCVNGGSAN